MGNGTNKVYVALDCESTSEDIDFIAGYFQVRVGPRNSLGRARFARRSCKYAAKDGYPKEYDDYVQDLLSISRREFAKLSKMDLSIYVDVRHIKYRDSVQRP